MPGCRPRACARANLLRSLPLLPLTHGRAARRPAPRRTQTRQGGQERCRLLCWRSGALAFLVLLNDLPAAVLPAAAAVVARLLAGRAPPVAERLAVELPQKLVWHVPGLRYHYADGLAGVERWAGRLR